jgi:prepilin-type N-terminal cleavage/methylation domain-containing protein
MLQRSIEKQRSGEGGFTLIELLVVIVILGILAAIVVFAIGGLSDSSQTSACNADAATLKTAEDAFYASPTAPGATTANQTYATEAQLLSAKLIKALSTNYNISGVSATGYSLDAQNTKCTATTGP